MLLHYKLMHVTSLAMEILLDSADIAAIETILPFYPIAGFTTNPSILAKDCKDIKDTLNKMKELAGDTRTLHIQTTESQADKIFNEAKHLQRLFGKNFHIKIPVTDQGLHAMSLCRTAEIKVTATAIFTPMQALLAALSGANYVAPYVNRISDIGGDGCEVLSQIATLLEKHNLKTQILAASFKNTHQVFQAFYAGAGAVTVSPDTCKKLLFHPYTDKSLIDFSSDWNKKFGNKRITELM